MNLDALLSHPIAAMYWEALGDPYLAMQACLKKQTDKGWVYAKHIMDLPTGASPTTVVGTLGLAGLPFAQTWP